MREGCKVGLFRLLQKLHDIYLLVGVVACNFHN